MRRSDSSQGQGKDIFFPNKMRLHLFEGFKTNTKSALRCKKCWFWRSDNGEKEFDSEILDFISFWSIFLGVVILKMDSISSHILFYFINFFSKRLVLNHSTYLPDIYSLEIPFFRCCKRQYSYKMSERSLPCSLVVKCNSRPDQEKGVYG